MVITPIFQVPDEPSHFSIIEFISQNGHRPNPRKDRQSSLLTLKVSQIVNFNWQIQHPVWQGYENDWQQKISSLDKNLALVYQKNYYQTSLKRPPLYYYLAALIYYPVKGLNFLTGFFILRLFSVILGLLIVYLSFLITQVLFNHKLLSFTVANLVAFHPLFSFIGIGIHYDPLAALTASLFIYLVINFIKQRRKKLFYWSLLVGLIGIFIKPDLIILPLSLLFFLPKNKLKLYLPLSVLCLVLLALSVEFLDFLVGHSSVISDKLLYVTNISEYATSAKFFVNHLVSGKIFIDFGNYIKQTAAIHWSQVFPWYWGVFGWLEATLPPFIYQILKLITLVSLIGWLKLLVTQHSTITLSKTKIKSLAFLIFFSFIQAALVIFNDFKIFTTTDEIYGIQGRYFLPAIIAHMLLLIFGLIQLVPKKTQPYFLKLTIFSSFLLNLVGLYTLYQFFGWVWH